MTRIVVVLSGVQPYIRIVARNGQTLMVSEGYSSLSNARRAAHAVSRRMPLARVVEEL